MKKRVKRKARDRVASKLRRWLTCTRCGLCEFRRNVVLGKGAVPADILFVGEGPGKSEDLRGEPFVGPAGRILGSAIERATELAKLKRAPSYYITNVVACRPTDKKGGDNRDPTTDEINACWTRLERTEQIVQPKHIVLLGKVAERAALYHYPDSLCLFHPSYIDRKGGVGSTEYRNFVRELVELFRQSSKKRVFDYGDD